MSSVSFNIVPIIAPEAKAEGSTCNDVHVSQPRANAVTYFLLHVGIQYRILGNLLTFLQRFAEASKVKNLVANEEEIVDGGGIQD